MNEEERKEFTEWVAMIIRSYDTDENSFNFIQMIGGLEALVKHQYDRIQKLNSVVNKLSKMVLDEDKKPKKKRKYV